MQEVTYAGAGGREAEERPGLQGGRVEQRQEAGTSCTSGFLRRQPALGGVQALRAADLVGSGQHKEVKLVLPVKIFMGNPLFSKIQVNKSSGLLLIKGE